MVHKALNGSANIWLVPLLAALLTWSVYLLTMPPDLTWAHYGLDGGDLITAAVTWGVPHPTGYPLYILLGKLFSLLPIGTLAWRFHLLSATAVALATAFLTHTNQTLLRPTQNATTASVAGALTFAFTPLVWGQATIAEVYPLYLLLLTACLWSLFTHKPAWLTGLLFGLSLTAHLTALLILPLLIYHLHRPPTTANHQPLTRESPQTPLKTAALATLIGLLPLLLPLLLGRSQSPVIWGNPHTLPGWWWLISGALYQPNLLALPLADLPTRLAQWSLSAAAAWGWVGWLILIGGVLLAWKRPYNPTQRPLIITLLTTAALYILYALSYATEDAILYTLPTWLLLSLLLPFGLQHLNKAALILPALLLLLHFPTQNSRHQPTLQPAITTLLTESPNSALLLSSDTGATFALWYGRYALQQRPDLIIVDSNLFQFDWYRQRLQALNPQLFVPPADDLAQFEAQNSTQRPYCQVHIQPQTYTPTSSCGNQ
jgi:hypothetical protein